MLFIVVLVVLEVVCWSSLWYGWNLLYVNVVSSKSGLRNFDRNGEI